MSIKGPPPYDKVYTYTEECSSTFIVASFFFCVKRRRGKMKLVSLLSGNGFVLYNKDIARSLSVNSAIIFGQICSSFESFEKKGMLTEKDGKDYFFLTSDVIEQETALSYKLQLKAIKELEAAGYIETKLMGVPSKKYFHITNKIVEELVPSSDKKEDLEKEESIPEQDSNGSSLSHRENVACTNESGKRLPLSSTIKNKNEKEKYKIKRDKSNYLEEEEDLETEVNSFAFKEFKSYFQDTIEPEMFEKIHNEMKQQRLEWFTVYEAKHQVSRMNKKGKAEIYDWAKYFVGGIIKNRISKVQAVSERKFKEAEGIGRKIKQEARLTRALPFYNWLEE